LTPNIRAVLGAKRPTGPSTPSPAKSLRAALDLHTVEHSIEARMPESMAMLKLKGFIHDLGGEIVESLPGLIRVRLADGAAEKKASLFGWLEKRTAVQAAPSSTEIELHMTRPDPSQPGRLTVTLILRANGAAVTPEWKSRCNQISRDLQAYLIGR
jgi:serine/threonine-protein kinase